MALGAPTVPDSPVQYHCQKNFVIIITDGEPTRDDFDLNLPTNTAIGFADFNNLIGDFNADAEVENPGGFAGCTTCEATRWLDDIALFMNTEDFRPDMADHNGSEQTIDTYTVGFTTSDFANEILLKTAQVGNGQFYFSTDPEALAADIIAAISDIIQKSQSFTAATVPAARTSAGGQFYTSLFVPSDLNGYWEGHLNAWEITSDGDILDSLGNCALDDPLAPTECSAGAFLASAVPFWDAGAVLSSSTVSTRNLEVSLGGTKQSFDTANAALDARGARPERGGHRDLRLQHLHAPGRRERASDVDHRQRAGLRAGHECRRLRPAAVVARRHLPLRAGARAGAVGLPPGRGRARGLPHDLRQPGVDAARPRDRRGRERWLPAHLPRR